MVYNLKATLQISVFICNNDYLLSWKYYDNNFNNFKIN